MKSFITTFILFSSFSLYSQSFDPSLLVYYNSDEGVQNSIAAVDFDNDGLKDILMSGSSPNVFWIKNLGGNQFGTKDTIFDDEIFGERARPMDINNDGNMDIIAACSFSNVIITILGNGDGTFQDAIVIEDSLEPLTDLKIFDVNVDGFDDISFSTYSSTDKIGKVYWSQNNGTGGFMPRVVIAPDALDTENIEYGDLDGDNLPDLISKSAWDDKFTWFKNLGDGNFSNEIEVRPPLTSLGSRPLFLADIDADGDNDLLAYESPTISLYINDGNGDFELKTTPLSSYAWSISARDFDQDGHVDIFCGGGENESAIVLYNNGDGTFQDETILDSGVGQIKDIWITDMDDDGVQDILTASSLFYGYLLFINSYDGPLSNIELDDNSLNVVLYPNPASEKITFSSTDNSIINIVEIYDINGTKLLTHKANLNESESISLNHLPNGLYAAIFKDFEGRIIAKKKISKLK